MSRVTIAAMMLLLAWGGTALAQPARNATERTKDQRELRDDQRETVDDQNDLQRLTYLLARYDHARALNNIPVLDSIEVELGNYLAAELAESHRELQEDRAEAAQSKSEVRSDRRERGRNQATGAPPGAKANDRHDTRDDRRDQADDKRDLQAERRQQERKRAIADEFRTLRGRHDATSLARKRDLIVSLWQLAQEEVRGNADEVKEDKHELHEDRRETREDIRRR